MKHLGLKKIVLIGASTGGPGQIQKIITSLPSLGNTSIIIAQHMATEFLPSFVKRLQESSLNPITIAENNDMLLSGHIYFCNGKTQVDAKNSSFYFISDASYTNGYNPNINSIFTSLSKYTGSFDLLGVILTGIGDDGVDGCRQLAINGAKTLTETSQSAIVDGMPFRARECVPNITVQKIDDIIKTIKEFCY